MNTQFEVPPVSLHIIPRRPKLSITVERAQPGCSRALSPLEGLSSALHLIPYFRPESVDLAREDGAGFEVVEPMVLHDFLCSLLAA